MKKAASMAVLMLMLGTLCGCETAKSTISGPFIGLEKDINNFGTVTSKMCEGLNSPANDPDQVVPQDRRGVLRKADDWVREHMW
jgi:hypothetical protein